MNRRADRWPWVWFAIVVLLLVTLGGFAIAYFHASAAADQASGAARRSNAISQCINDVLATREKLTAADHANERQKILDQRAATRDQNAGLAQLAIAKTPKDGIVAYRLFQKGSAEFEKALVGWLDRDAAIKKQRDANPLGRC